MTENFEEIEQIIDERASNYGIFANHALLSQNLKKEAYGGESATGQDLDGRGRTSLRKEWQNLYHYVKGGNDSLTTIRREMMFINLLQGLHPKESEVLILTKDKNLTDKYKISFENVKEAYPDIKWGGRS